MVRGRGGVGGGGGLGLPGFGADEFDEAAGADVGGVELVAEALDAGEHLVVGGAEGEDGDAAVGELGEEELAGEGGGAGCDEEAVEGRRCRLGGWSCGGCGRGVWGPAEGSVGVLEVDVAEVEGEEAFEGGVEEGFDAFDGVDVGGEVGEDCGVVAGAGADFEDGVVGLELEAVGHEGDDVGLGDGLAVADGVRAVGVDVVAGAGGEEEVAGYGAECGEEAFVGDAAFDDLNAEHFVLGGVGGVGVGGVHVGGECTRKERN